MSYAEISNNFSMNPTAALPGTLTIGVRSIDIQHRELFELIEAFEDAQSGGDIATAVGTILPHLEAYVIFHFSEEEKLMASLIDEESYIRMHQSQHQAFSEKIQEIKGEFQVKNNTLIVEELRAILRTWLTQHIATTDASLGRKLLAQGSPKLWG